MKQVKIITICFFFCSNIHAQSYFKFIDTNSIWRDLKVLCNTGPSYKEEIDLDVQVFLQGDTIIGNSFTKLYLKGTRKYSLYDHGNTADDSSFYCNKYIGALREDSLKHVYSMDTLGNEKMLFNFNLNVGDSIPSYVFGPNYVYVVSVDSVLIHSKYRKRFNFNYSSPLIEGIGTGIGLLGEKENYAWTCPHNHSKVYFYKNTKAYCFPNVNYPQDSTASLFNCTPSGIDEQQKNITIKISPNPFNDFLTIQLLNNTEKINEQINVIDDLGRVMLKEKITSNITKVDFSLLKNGIYYLNCTGKLAGTPVVKIVKIRN